MQYSLKEIEGQITDLPMLPSVLFKLSQANPNDVDFFDDLHALASNDPTLASLIISSANSAESSPNVCIHSLRAALLRRGSNNIYKTIALASVAKVFIPSKQEHKDLWLHSIQVAIITSEVYKHVYGEGDARELSYLCGLLHDIGRLVLFQVSPSVLEQVEDAFWQTPDELIQIENENLGYDHSSLGFLAAQKMKVPSLICNIIRFHHSSTALTHPKVPKVMKRILLCLQVADAMCVFFARNSEDFDNTTHKDEFMSYVFKAEWGESEHIIGDIFGSLMEHMDNANEQAKVIGF